MTVFSVTSVHLIIFGQYHESRYVEIKDRGLNINSCLRDIFPLGSQVVINYLKTNKKQLLSHSFI